MNQHEESSNRTFVRTSSTLTRTRSQKSKLDHSLCLGILIMGCRFSLKFQQIVANEQEDNFISRLHGGKLAIIPWPVIESRQFYTLFQAVKKRLDMQPITHGKAGIFLQTMKTLMAKLKVGEVRLCDIRSVV